MIISPIEQEYEDIVFEPTYNRHYILLDNSGYIIDGWSDGPYPNRDISNAICINEQGGYQFRLSPNGEENPALFSFDSYIPLYKYEEGEILSLTEIETIIYQAKQDNRNLPSIKL